MAVTTTSLGDLLKINYASWEIEQMVNLTVPVLAECAAEGSAQLGGSGFIYPVRLTSAESHAYITESQTLPETAGPSTIVQAEIDPVIHAGTVTLSGLAMSVSSTNAMAFARAFDENVSQTIQAMGAYKEGTLFRNGSGRIGEIASRTDADTVVLDAEPNTIREGMVIAIEDSAGGSTAWHNGAGAGATNGRLTVSDIDWSTNTLDFTGASPDVASAVADGDFLYIAGSQLEDAADATNREPTGLDASVSSSGTYAGIVRGTDAFASNWESTEIAVSGFFDESQLLRARTRITQESGVGISQMSNSFKVVCHPNQVDVLFKLALSRIRYSGNEDFDLGNSRNVNFGGIPFSTSYNCPLTVAYMGDWSYHKSLYTPGGKLHIDTQYNGSPLKWVSTFDRGLVFLKEYHNFLLTKPTCFAKFTSLTAATK